MLELATGHQLTQSRAIDSFLGASLGFDVTTPSEKYLHDNVYSRIYNDMVEAKMVNLRWKVAPEE